MSNENWKAILITISVSIFFILISNGCNEHGSEQKTLWRSRGYGLIVELGNTHFKIFDVTEVSCLERITRGLKRDDALLIEKDGEEIEIGRFVISGDELTFEASIETVIFFDRIDDMPYVDIEKETSDPEANFEVFWAIFEENCALFGLTGVDWKKMYEDYRPLVTQETSQERLFEIFKEMVTPLNDGHTTLSDDENSRYFEGGPDYESKWLIDEAYEQDYIINTAGYLVPESVQTTGNGYMLFGIIQQPNAVYGYLNILSFDDYSENGDLKIEKEVFNDGLDRVFNSFNENKVNAIVIDIRLNEGGEDALALLLAGRFIQKKRVAFSKMARFGEGYDDFTEVMDYEVLPSSAPMLNMPVVLLTSRNSMSASDVATMVLNDIPEVTIIGERTYGEFSNMLDKTLPNGWKINLSNESYLSSEGVDYEQKGIAPDIVILPDVAAFNDNRDNIMEGALDYLNGTN